MACKATVPFKIKDNILIGEEVPIDNECTNIGDLILNRFKSKPDFVGQVDAATGEESTYRQMRERSVRCALWLKKQDVKSGDVVVICTHNHLNAYVPYLATLYNGATANIWNVLYTKGSMQSALSKIVPPKVIFINRDKAAAVHESAREVRVSAKIVVFGEAEGFESLESILNGHFDETEIDGFSCAKLRSIRDPALILSTSGTTGYPKGVEIAYASFVIPMTFHISSDDVALWLNPLHWISSALLTVRTIVSCTKVIKSSGFDKDRLCQVIEKYKVTWLLLESTMVNHLFRTGVFARCDVSSLRKIVIAGSPIRRDVYEGFVKLLPNVSIMGAYGMTETSGLTQQPNTGKAGSSGYVKTNVRLMIADFDTGKRLGPNERGEICCKTPGLMNGYYKSPEETTNVFDDDGWFHTGDVGYYDEDGDVFVVDRLRELIKYKGYHVSPTEIEVLLQTHPAVLEAAVMPVPHHIDSQHPIAFVTKMPGVNVTEEELVRLVAENLEDVKRLRSGVVFLKEMPRVISGKINRKELRDMAKTYAEVELHVSHNK